MEKEKDLMKKGERVLEDNVVGIKGVKISDTFLIIKDVYWPDLPIGETKTTHEQIFTGCTGDFHIGSNMFLEKPVEKWIKYLNGEGLTKNQLDRVGKLQYLFVVGDNVSGVGVYPGQLDELVIKDLYKQYEAFEDIMLQIPEYIQVFICTTKGTILHTFDGYKKIEDIRPNDYVLSYNEKSKKIEFNRVTSNLVRNSNKLIQLTFSGGIKLQCTLEHPLLIIDNMNLVWKKAEELKIGNFLPCPLGHFNDDFLYSLNILKQVKSKVYLDDVQLVKKLDKIGFFKKIPSRTKQSYIAGESPLPLSTVIELDSFKKYIKFPISVKTHSGKYIKLPNKIPKELFYFIGMLLTDGSFSIVKNKFPDGRVGSSYKMRIFNSNLNIINEIKKILSDLLIFPTAEYKEITKTKKIGLRITKFKKSVYYLEYTNKLLGEILIVLGINPGNKKKHTLGKISNCTWEYVQYLLAGLFDGDGTKSKTGVQLVSSSKDFAHEIFLLLQEHGFAPNIYYNNIYRVSLHRNKDLAKFKSIPTKRLYLTEFNINNKISEGILKSIYPHEKYLSKEFGGLRKIIKIESIEGEKVYNIEVEKAHTYAAMGIINHNCPGQHDGVRRAEPQPAIPKEFMPRLHKMRNMHFIASPSWVETEGLKNLVYHGPSIHDLISSVSFLDMNKPQEGMIELLKKRDLMPKYGGRNPYVPEGRDYMVVKEVPDLVWIGDMHHNGYASYRGTTVLNGGCWEGQTDFQKKIGHVPTPGVFPMVDLSTRKITEVYFTRNNLQKEVSPENTEDQK